MSIEYLTEAEQYYFERFGYYKQAIYSFLRERKLPLRLASVDKDSSHVTTFMGLMQKAKGAAKGKDFSKSSAGKWRFVKRRR